MGDYTPKVGDSVRVSFEGEVTSVNTRSVKIGSDGPGRSAQYVMFQDGVSVEKVEPPVEVFKPGDVIRHKLSGGLWTLGSDGHAIYHNNGQTLEWDAASGFNSKFYERVELG